MTRKFAPALLVGGVLATTLGAASAQEQVVNLYSARHYSTDEALYNDFTKATGIRINRVDADDAGILARLKAEGSASPADVILLVDAARLHKGEVDGLFNPIQSKVLIDAKSGSNLLYLPLDKIMQMTGQPAGAAAAPASTPPAASPASTPASRSLDAAARSRERESR